MEKHVFYLCPCCCSRFPEFHISVTLLKSIYFTHFLSAVCLKAVPESPYFLVHMCHPLDLITVISSQFLPNMLSISNLMLVFCKLYFLFIIKLRNLDLCSLNIVCWNRYEHDLIKTENRREASMCAC